MNRYESLAILQLSESASWREVQTAYKYQLVKWHPDKFNGSGLMASYTEEKCKVASEAFLCLKELYEEGVLPMRPASTSSSACVGASNISDFNGLHNGMGQIFEEARKTRFEYRPRTASWRKKVFLSAREWAGDVIGLIVLPFEFALCLLKVFIGNSAVFPLFVAPLLSGYIVMNTLVVVGERAEYVASAISVATMGSNDTSGGKDVQAGVPESGVYLGYKKLKGQFISALQSTR